MPGSADFLQGGLKNKKTLYRFFQKEVAKRILRAMLEDQIFGPKWAKVAPNDPNGPNLPQMTQICLIGSR